MSLFYRINVYYHWVPSHHTAALFGNWVSRNSHTVFPVLRQIKLVLLLIAITATGGMAVAEA